MPRSAKCPVASDLVLHAVTVVCGSSLDDTVEHVPPSPSWLSVGWREGLPPPRGLFLSKERLKGGESTGAGRRPRTSRWDGAGPRARGRDPRRSWHACGRFHFGTMGPQRCEREGRWRKEEGLPFVPWEQGARPSQQPSNKEAERKKERKTPENRENPRLAVPGLDPGTSGL